jgi:hypothetical protein
LAGVLAGMLGAAACQPVGSGGGAVEAGAPVAQSVAPPTQAAPLPLRIPFLAVMTGSVNASSYDVFRAAASDQALSDQDWLRVGEAAVSLVGDASLITLPGTGPNDADWAADPKWRQLAASMQSAGFAVGAAANKKDRAALTEATASLAQSCQACHLEFSPHLVTSQPEPEPSAPRN